MKPCDVGGGAPGSRCAAPQVVDVKLLTAASRCSVKVEAKGATSNACEGVLSRNEVDKCICVVDGTDQAEIVATLGAHVDASAFAAVKQLEVIRAPDMYLRSGAFSADEVISSWKAATSDVMYDGRRCSWRPRLPRSSSTIGPDCPTA